MFINHLIKSIIPSSHVIGTGFLIGKDAIDKTRRKTLISKLCNRPIRFQKSLKKNKCFFD